MIAAVVVGGEALAGFAAFLIAALTAYLTLGPMRGELEACRRDRRDLRYRLEIVTGAIVGMLPEPDRLQLLRRIDEHIPRIDEAA